MELIIENPNNLNLDAFCSYLISEMIEYIDKAIEYTKYYMKKIVNKEN